MKARSYTYLANEINRVFYEAIQAVGLDPSEYAQNQQTVEAGLRTWLTLRQLEAAYLEIFDPASGRVASRIDLGIAYSETGKETYHTAIDEVRAAISGAGRLTGCRYRVVVSTSAGAAPVKGWAPTELQSVDHLKRRDLKNVIETPAASSDMSVWY
ncbi:hypothetical protein AB0K60_13355 [Thermopolyspora sp. NPDC052614]|uniref:hypothetical protein n=1 Tax=Thermopolyspora sp. NPDC052614 TaxID=3155682 RepID=UPI0034493E57